MTVADWALVISLGAVAISLATFVWSIWSHFIFPKPKVQTSIAVMHLLQPGVGCGPPCVSLSATNHGPAEVTLHMAIARKARRWFQRRPQIAILNPYNAFPHDLDTSGPFSGGLPKKLAVGEQFSAYFPVSKNWFEKLHLVGFGFTDTFGRNHWCPPRLVREVRKKALAGEEAE